MINGTQSSDGTIERTIVTNCREDLTACEARQLASLLIESADELDVIERRAAR